MYKTAIEIMLIFSMHVTRLNALSKVTKKKLAMRPLGAEHSSQLAHTFIKVAHRQTQEFVDVFIG